MRPSQKIISQYTAVKENSVASLAFNTALLWYTDAFVALDVRGRSRGGHGARALPNGNISYSKQFY